MNKNDHFLALHCGYYMGHRIVDTYSSKNWLMNCDRVANKYDMIKKCCNFFLLI